MRVSHIALDDFRSYRHVVVEFEPGISVLLGANGQGKTNLVEAIAYLSAFSSHRVSAEASLVRIPLDPTEEPPSGAVIRVKAVMDGHRESIIELELIRGKANRARLNRNNARPRDIIGMVRTVVFAPEDLQLIKGDPSVRRQFLDDIAVQMNPLVASIRSDFDKVARQRAALLKSAQSSLRRGFAPDLSTLAVWNDNFATLSSQLTAARARIVEQIAQPAALAHDTVAQSGRDLTLSFDASLSRHSVDVGDLDLKDVDTQRSHLLAALEEAAEKEVERGVNLIGAHRDDLFLKLGHMPVKGFASHGESWSVALGLRLGAYNMMKADGEEPILILDDVFAELDSFRREALADIIKDAEQVLITAAVEDDLPQSLQHEVKKVHFDAERGTLVDT